VTESSNEGNQPVRKTHATSGTSEDKCGQMANSESPGNCHQSRDVPEAYEYSRLNWPLLTTDKKGKGSPYSITERMVPELIPVLGSQPAV